MTKAMLKAFACVAACAFSLSACISDTEGLEDTSGEEEDEDFGVIESPAKTPLKSYGARIWPSDYIVVMPDGTNRCGKNGSLADIIKNAPNWDVFRNEWKTWDASAGDVLLHLADYLRRKKIKFGQQEHTAAFWALMAAHNAEPKAASFPIKVIASSKFDAACQVYLFGKQTNAKYLFVVRGGSEIYDRIWKLNRGNKNSKKQPRDMYSLDYSLLCFADPKNSGAARQVAIWDGQYTWMAADPPRSGIARFLLPPFANYVVTGF